MMTELPTNLLSQEVRRNGFAFTCYRLTEGCCGGRIQYRRHIRGTVLAYWMSHGRSPDIWYQLHDAVEQRKYLTGDEHDAFLEALMEGRPRKVA